MNDPADATTSLSGNGNLTRLPLDRKGPAMSSGVEQAAASTAILRAAETDPGKPNQGSTLQAAQGSSDDAVENSQNGCSGLLSDAISDAELLAVYVSRNGINIGAETIQAIADAREHFEKGKLIGSAEAATFLKHYRELAAAAYPVTVVTLRDSTVPLTHSVPWWLFFLRNYEFIRANVASIIHWVFSGIALLLLIIMQSYYVIGNNLIQFLPEYRLLGGQKEAILSGVEPKSEAEQFDGLLKADRTMLCRWLAWCPLIDTPVKVSTTSDSLEANAGTTSKAHEADTDATVVMSVQLLGVLQGYLLPLLYGWIGAAAYVLRCLAREARERLYRQENDTAYTLRIFLGALAGLAIGWFLKPEDVSGFKSLSPFALAFVAGYSVDLLFTFLDKIVNAFSTPQVVPPPKAAQGHS
jgi:hypothetical protein